MIAVIERLSETEWKSLIAKITFNEINRYYSKKPLVLTDDHLEKDQEQQNLDDSIISPQLVIEIAEELRKLDKFKDFLTPQNITMLYKSAPLHDIGKVGIPDSILLKQGKLTDDEFEIMKLHSTYGHDAIEAAINTMHTNNNFLRFAKEIAYGHHEKWDGSGYPLGLSGDDIPLSARLMALADVYDALISKRVYKPAFSHDKSVAIILEGKGSHFDPEIVDAFMRIQQACYETSQKYADVD